jgi:hypothetical protein
MTMIRLERISLTPDIVAFVPMLIFKFKNKVKTFRSSDKIFNKTQILYRYNTGIQILTKKSIHLSNLECL